MDPKTPVYALLAPPSSASVSAGGLRMPGRDGAPGSSFPPVDEPLVRPETRAEMVRGRRLRAMPALAPHGDQHFRLDYVIGAYLEPGYVGSTDLLTRLDEGSNFATDTCIRRAGIDPRTGTRHLEELAFEVVHEQSTKDITERAEDLTARGVRRVLAIFVKKREACEWSAPAHAWTPLGLEDVISDPCLARPIAVRDLLDAATADDAVARALVEKNNPVIAAVRSAERKGGQATLLARQMERRLGRPLTEAERAALGERLDRLGVDRVDDVREALAGEALAAWLAESGGALTEARLLQ